MPPDRLEVYMHNRSRPLAAPAHVPLSRRLTSPCRAGSRPLAAPAHVPLSRRLTPTCRAGSRPSLLSRRNTSPSSLPITSFWSRRLSSLFPVGSRPSCHAYSCPFVSSDHVPCSRRLTSPPLSFPPRPLPFPMLPSSLPVPQGLNRS